MTLNISVSTKLPSAGLLYSISSTLIDSAKQVFKLDTNLNQTSLSINIPNFKKAGNYSLTITVTSKSTNSNSISKSINLTRNNFILVTSSILLDVNGFSKEDIATGIDGSVSGTIYDIVN